jgi:3-phosphoshikimate 1-carboxyvinyltransferase
MLPLGKGRYILNGNERMQQRPINDLIITLNDLGVEVRDMNNTGCPPVQIAGGGLKGGNVSIPGANSSQYVSAIMMAAPYAEKDTHIQITGELVSRTYVEMTQRIMTEFGAECTWQGKQQLRIAPKSYRACDYEIEGDASSASYFFGMAAVTGGRIAVTGLTRDSSQGDLGILDILEQMGCSVSWKNNEVIIQGKELSAVDVDMNTMSDVAPTLAVVSLFAKGTTFIRNVANMRIKECDRISATVTELRKLGAVVEEWEDGLSIKGGGDLKGAELETYDDHRMAMSFSLAGLKVPGVTILEPGCVSKTFPRFYDMFLPLIQG